MKIIVGLGNPGEEYNFTRHNIGFMFLDSICKEKFSKNINFNSLEHICFLNNEKVILVKPLSFMNLSGEVVEKYIKYYKLKSEDLLVIQDDLDMSVGRYKLMFNRGDGGHNGIKSIINCLSSKRFYRLKIGISKNDNFETRDYVLGKFSSNELSLVHDSFDMLSNLIDDFVSLNKDVFFQKYNTRVDD